MKAMIFAAGLGTRLKPITDKIPKALVPIAGKPLLEHVILKLKAAGFNEIIVNVHHFAQQIIDFINENNQFGIRIEISDESDELLETGGGIKKAARFFDDEKPFLVHNADILSNVDLSEMYEKHLSSEADISLLVSNRESSRYLYFNHDDKLQGWMNVSTGETKSPYIDFDPDDYTGLAFAGIHLVSPKIFEHMQKWNGKFSIIDFYLSIAGQLDLLAYCPDNLEMIDVGKLHSLEKAEEFVLK